MNKITESLKSIWDYIMTMFGYPPPPPKPPGSDPNEK